MLEKFFYTMNQAMSSELTVTTELTTLFCALILGLCISVTYMLTKKRENHSQSFVITLVMLPVILAIIIVFVGSNVARAFSLAGTLSIIRFRSAPGDPKDIGYIFFAIAAGLSCGVGVVGYGIIFTFFLCVVLLLLAKFNFGRQSVTKKNLKITIPENLNYQDIFESILSSYSKTHILTRVKTCDMGSLYELHYDIDMIDGKNEKDFIDELRTKNGNLNISLSLADN